MSSTYEVALRELAERTGELRTTMYAAAEAFREVADEHFDSEGDGDWPAWSESYRQRAGRGLLDRTGELRASFTDRSNAQHIQSVSDSRLRVGSGSHIARYHRAGRTTMPARNPMPPFEAFEHRWRGKLDALLTGDDGFGL